MKMTADAFKLLAWPGHTAHPVEQDTDQLFAGMKTGISGIPGRTSVGGFSRNLKF